MEYARLGPNGLLSSRVGVTLSKSIFSPKENAPALSSESAETLSSDARSDAVDMLRAAYDAGVNLFDTFRFINMEELIGTAFYDKRNNVILCSRSQALNQKSLLQDFNATLNSLNSDYVDIYQYQSNDFIPKPTDKNGILSQLKKLKSTKKIHNIGFITEDHSLAKAAVLSGDFDTIQTPFNVASSEDVISLVKLCEERDVGFLAMLPLCGGVLKDIPLAEGFLQQFLNVIPIWGVKNSTELDQVLYFNDHPPIKDEKFYKDVESLKKFFN